MSDLEKKILLRDNDVMISVTLLTCNSEKRLKEVLTSVAHLDEVIVLDTGSTDHTLEIAKSFPNVKIHHSIFKGFGPLRNEAIALAKNDWILSLDSDEVLSTPFDLPLDPSCVYSFPFHNFFRGKRIRGCGWSPDRHVRLFNRKKTTFSNAHVHEKVQMRDMTEIPLGIPIYHYSYSNLSDFLVKMERYSTLFAQQNQGRKSSIFKALTHGFFAFFKSYVLKYGFIDGREGYIISLYNAHTAYYKYLKLAEICSS